MTAEPELSPPPDLAETHISTVFFAGDRAFKLLKPIRTGFLDYSTVERRLEAIDQELALNRRLAPDVYLGSADVIEEGRITDRMLVMRRMPADRRLPELVGTADLDAHVRSIARAVAAFHEAQEPHLDAVHIAGAEAVATNWAGNHAVLDRVPGHVLPSNETALVRELVDGYLDHHHRLFQRRIDEGFVRDGHGDLTAQDIFCLDDGPRILDCLAFDPLLRIGDVLADIAFLAMDLHRLAGIATARRFIGWYCEFTGEHHPASLAHHYVAYRAHVRAKVEAIRLDQGETSSAEALVDYHDLCLHHLERARPTVVLVGGTPGTGKTTLAGELSSVLGFAVLSSDGLRKDLAGRGHLVREEVAADEGIYNPAMSEQTYAELLDRGAQLIDRGESVILDASWNRERHRAGARAMADRVGAHLVQVECTVDQPVAEERIASRLARGVDASDARPELLDELRRRFEPWPAAMAIDTGVATDEAVTAVLDRAFPRIKPTAAGDLISR